MASAQKFISIPVCFQVPAVEKISQSELSEFVETRNLIEQLRARVDDLESRLKARLESGASVQPGVHVVSLKEGSRRNVAWKDVTMRLAERLEYEPEVYVANVLAHTRPTKTVSPQVS